MLEFYTHTHCRSQKSVQGQKVKRT